METATVKTKKKKKKLWWLIIPAVIILLIVIGIFRAKNAINLMASSYTQATAQTRDISVVVNAASTVSPLDSYTVLALVRGDVTDAPFEEGDVIEKGDILYQIDTSDMESTIRQAEESVKTCGIAAEQAALSLQSAKRSYEEVSDSFDDLLLTSKVTGQVVTLNYEEGDSVTAGAVVAEVADRTTMILEIPFHSTAAQNISAGAGATVSVGSETLSGTVTKVSGADSVGTGGILTRIVSISVKNPGGITEGTTATASVGSYSCSGTGTFKYNASSYITAVAAGDINEMFVSEGSYVTDGADILRIDSTPLENQLASAKDSVTASELSYQSAQNALDSAKKNLEDAKDALDDYTITSPISGTVVEKNFKVGDTIDATSSATAMAVIYDLSALEVVLDIDELDISNMQVGHEVSITADALSGETYIGNIARIGINGKTNGGITSYPVTVRMDDEGNLLPGMNVTADILISEATGVLAIPTSAVSRGNTVLLADESSSGNLPDGVPAGYRRIEVSLGRSDDEYIEVLSGLSEGDVVAIDTSTSSIMDYMMTNGNGESDGEPSANNETGSANGTNVG
ncbi:MAG: efflux RND transporter periplasmic adaptor subunit [Oscillospiraceae bacterium]